MRPLYLLLLVPLFTLAACRGTQAYSNQDLQDVKHGWAEIHPTYLAFRSAFLKNDLPGMRTVFARETVVCKIPDAIDNRDTIDPNSNLFYASIALDDMCNTMETAYASWERWHNLPYDKTIVVTPLADMFTSTDLELKKWKKYMANPAAFA